jgi:hypothetical protein
MPNAESPHSSSSSQSSPSTHLKYQRTVSIPKEFRSLRNAIQTNSEPTVVYVTQDNVRYRVSFQAKKRLSPSSSPSSDEFDTTKRKKFFSESESDHPSSAESSSEEVVPLQEIFTPWELKWTQNLTEFSPAVSAAPFTTVGIESTASDQLSKLDLAAHRLS